MQYVFWICLTLVLGACTNTIPVSVEGAQGTSVYRNDQAEVTAGGGEATSISTNTYKMKTKIGVPIAKEELIGGSGNYKIRMRGSN